MLWVELKLSVRKVIRARELANHNIRLNALDRVDEIVKAHFRHVVDNPEVLLTIGKNEFKDQLSMYKDLSGAESSVINNLFQILESKS